jgi:glycosyltransferase involved in cell wall biosynthesis
MNLMLFTSTGSDQGHRAVSEAMACGTPVVSFPIPGVDEVVGGLASELTVGEASPECLAQRVVELLARPDLASLRQRSAAAMREFDYEHTAARLIRLYESVMK